MRRALIILTISLAPAVAAAQGAAPLPMGPRTGPMGGAGVARGDDSAMAFLNPAGLARTSRDTLSMSLSAYALSATRYRSFFADPGADLLSGFDVRDNELKQTTFVAIPTALSYVLHFGSPGNHHVVAFSVLTPRAHDRDLEGSLTADSFAVRFDDRASLVSSARTYDVGPSYALELGSDVFRVRLGASAFIAYSTFSMTLGLETLSGTIPSTDFSQIELNRYTSASSAELVPVAGVQVDFGVISAGVAFHAPSLHLTGGYENSARQTQLANGVFDQFPEVMVTSQETGDYEERQPMRLLFGLALELERFTIAADAGITFGVGPYDVFTGDMESTTLMEGQMPQNVLEARSVPYENETVINFAAGVEYRFSPSFAVRAGAFTDFGNAKMPDDPQVSDFLLSKVDRFGAVAGVAFGGGSAATSISFAFTGGTGDAIGLDVGNSARPDGGRVVEAVSTTLSILASGTVDVESMFAQ